MPSPITAVLDTNILVRLALKKTDAAWKLWNALLEDKFQLALSESILAELDRVLHYPRISRKHKITAAVRQEYLEALRENAILVEELYEVARIETDPTDDMILACALEAYADYIVTEDNHLRAIKYYHGIQIVGLGQFMKETGL